MAANVDAEGPHTERAPPIATALTPPAPAYAAGMAVPPAPYVDHRSRGGGGGTGRVIALIALPILIGAGIVMVLVATGVWSPGSTAGGEPPQPPTQSPPAVANIETTTPAQTQTAPPPSVPPIVPTLAPTRPAPTTTAGPHPTGSGHPPPKAADAGAPSPTTAPTTLPPFGIPSGFPFPSAIPGLPPLFPSGMLPPWPPPGAPNGPTPAPGPSSGSI